MPGSKQGETKADAESAAGGRLAAWIEAAGEMPGPAPVDQWNPTHSGSIDIRIDRGGAWHHDGSRIERDRLVRLFSRVLRGEADGSYVLVTPVEKWTIAVDDVPFLAVDMTVEDRGGVPALVFVTNLGDIVTLDEDHPLRVGEPGHHDGLMLYLTVRGRLEARLTHSVVLELADLAEIRGPFIGVESAGQLFVIGPADAAETF